MLTCSKCGKSKPLTNYRKGNRHCKRCAADYMKIWRTRHADRINAEKRAQYAIRYKNDPAVQEGYRRRRMTRLFGITPSDWDVMFEAQNGCCAICQRTEAASRGHKGNKHKRRLAIDHCHETGKVRGLLCSRCNLVLGWIENKELFARIMAYLHKSPY